MSENRKVEVEAAQKGLDFAKNKYQLELDTSMGKITLDMLPEVAPGHCKNLLALAQIGYYDGLIFHRVIKGFMIQGGCPLGSGTGGPGYTINAEFNATSHEPGVLSMARTNDPNSAGSQFFICHGDPRFLDRQYTAFGKLIKGDDVLEKIATTEVGAQDRPVKKITMTSVKIVPRSEVK